jgi:hypothetical protein
MRVHLSIAMPASARGVAIAHVLIASQEPPALGHTRERSSKHARPNRLRSSPSASLLSKKGSIYHMRTPSTDVACWANLDAAGDPNGKGFPVWPKIQMLLL